MATMIIFVQCNYKNIVYYGVRRHTTLQSVSHYYYNYLRLRYRHLSEGADAL